MQAEQQLGPGWTLMKGGTPGCPEIPDWLASNLPEGSRIGIDPFLHTVSLLLLDSFQEHRFYMTGTSMLV